MNKHKIAYFTIFLFSVAAIIIWRDDIWLFLKDYGGVGGLIIGIVSPILSFIYLRSERWYLFVQRNIILPFMDFDTRWKVIVPYTFEAPIATNEAQVCFDAILHTYEERKEKFVVKTHLENKLEIVIKDEIAHTFTINGCILWFSTATFTIPNYKSSKTVDYYQELIDIIARKIAAYDYECQLTLLFGKDNPYFSYFVRHIPYNAVRNFSCNVDLTKQDGVRVEITKKKVEISGGSFVVVGNYARRCLEFSENLIGSSSF